MRERKVTDVLEATRGKAVQLKDKSDIVGIIATATDDGKLVHKRPVAPTEEQLLQALQGSTSKLRPVERGKVARDPGETHVSPEEFEEILQLGSLKGEAPPATIVFTAISGLNGMGLEKVSQVAPEVHTVDSLIIPQGDRPTRLQGLHVSGTKA